MKMVQKQETMAALPTSARPVTRPAASQPPGAADDDADADGDANADADAGGRTKVLTQTMATQMAPLRRR